MYDKKDAAVVVPVYQETLSLSENASLRQLFKVLKYYDIIFMIPEAMSDWAVRNNYRAVAFADGHFKGIVSYSKLLLSKEFYERFYSYEYILIYQLDAFVFSDKLSEFCKLGYDYIGAPMPRRTWHGIPGNVGNGGFSLRRVESCLRLLENKTSIYEETGKGNWFDQYEDKFWGYCGQASKYNFHVPDVKTALTFAIEFDVAGCYKKLAEYNLPFGCHAWSKPQYFDLWKPFIEKRVENEMSSIEAEIRDKGIINYRSVRKKMLLEYLLRRVLRPGNARTLNRIRSKLSGLKNCSLWGNGEFGILFKQLLEKCGIKVDTVFAKSINKKHVKDGICYCPAEAGEEIRDSISIIIASPKYGAEIEYTLKNMGKKESDDYYRAKFLFDTVGIAYAESFGWVK